MVKGQWVAHAYDNKFGIVRTTYDDLVDVVVYDRFGEYVGRDSPPEGGPTTFEPACDKSNWMPLAGRPAFPVKLWDMDKYRT